MCRLPSLGMVIVPALCVSAWGADDFSGLKGHWNFDEGRDWHNMEFPFSRPVSKADDSVGSNPLSLSGNLDPLKSWVSGRQFSGILFDAPGQLLKSARDLDELKGTSSLSYWLKTKAKGESGFKSSPGVIGDATGMIWGLLTPEGKLSVVQGGKQVAETSKPVNDGEWHHIVILRNAETGQVAIFLDGESSGRGNGATGMLSGEYKGFGAVKGGSGLVGVLDQIHLFNKAIPLDTIRALKENHAPKTYRQDALISRSKPSLTGSILHGYTFDPDQDPIGVSRFGQGKYGAVSYNKDGTFTYVPGQNFKGYDQFPVTVTDGRGGFSSTVMLVHDETTMSRTPVSKFSSYRDLAPLGSSDGKKGRRTMKAYDWDGDRRPDLLVCGNGRVWVYKNTGTRKEPGFDDPIEVKDSAGRTIEGNGISLLFKKGTARPALVVRGKDNTLSIYESSSVSRDGTKYVLDGKVKDEEGNPFKCSSEAFDIGDFDNDGRVDLLVGDPSRGIYFYKNEGSANEMKLKLEGELVIPGSYNLAPYFGDLDGDGKMDLVHGINWGTIEFWVSGKGKTIIEGQSPREIVLTDKMGVPPMKGEKTVLREMNGTHGAFADFNGDGIIDMAVGGCVDGMAGIAYGVNPNAAARNLLELEKIYNAYPRNLGKALEADGQKLLNRYKQLSGEWIMWAVGQRTVEGRERAYQMLKNHIAKYPFLKRTKLDAWEKYDDNRKLIDCGPMHHVPGIFVQNWVTLNFLKPDTAAHRVDVADALGMKGLDRDRYLKSGLPIADNNKCSEGQLLAIGDMTKYHPRILFPDDHLSIDRNMGDGREAQSYVFISNKNTFGDEVGGSACECAQDIKEAAEKCLGKGSATGDYFTFVMAHEVCHSLDAYVRGRANKELERRWNEMVVFAANNGSKEALIASGPDGWMDMEKTKENFQTKGLWDGSSPWDSTWEAYWENAPHKELGFMRGNIDWFLKAKQETLATQANHHWAGSEARLVGAIDRYNRGFKANINEVVLFLDFLSAGLNELPMYTIKAEKNPNRAKFHIDKAWLDRNDKGQITRITIGERVYAFELDDRGRVIKIKKHPFGAALGAVPVS